MPGIGNVGGTVEEVYGQGTVVEVYGRGTVESDNGRMLMASILFINVWYITCML